MFSLGKLRTPPSHFSLLWRITPLLLLSVLVIPYATAGPDTSDPSPVTVIGVWSPYHQTSNIKDTNLTPDTVFTIDINITNAYAITYYQLSLVYDPAILQATSLYFNNTIFSPNPSVYERIESGEVFLAVWSRIGPFNGTGTLAHLEMRVLSYGSSGLDIDRDRITPDAPHTIQPGCFRNTEQRNVTPNFDNSPNPGPAETSEYMMGDVAVGIILPESNGPLLNWTDTEVNATLKGITRAMEWWASQEPQARLRHYYDIHIRVPTVYEPIRTPDSVWIDDVMRTLGYNQSSTIDKVRAYNNQIRALLNTDWSFTIFVADSDNVNEGNLASGNYAYAFLGGPMVVMSRFSGSAYNSGNYFMAVPAHETGHIFYATDEYNAIMEYNGYLYSPDNDASTGIMFQNTLWVSPSTRRQIGWVDCDQNGVLDILDTKPVLRVDPFSTTINGTSLTLTGKAVDIPFPRTIQYTGRDISINDVTTVQYSLDNSNWYQAAPADGFFDTGLEDFTIQLEGLPAGNHQLIIQAENTVGNSASTVLEFTVLDTSPPTWPIIASLTATSLDSTRVFLAWTTATDDVKVVSYKLYQGTILIAVVPGTIQTYTVSNLLPGTDYTFTIEAGDAAGHWSTGLLKTLTTPRPEPEPEPEEEPSPEPETTPPPETPSLPAIPWWKTYWIPLASVVFVLAATGFLTARRVRGRTHENKAQILP